MLLSNYYLPTLKENPVEAKIKSHQLMLRAGMIRQLSSGIYNWLPLGLNVLDKISTKIRQGLNEAGLIEVLMSCIQPADLWKKSNRYDDYGKEMLKIKDRHDHDILFGPTNEEIITDMLRKDVKTYRDLPKNFYQIQWKFRDEIRPRFGVMRGREFLMKDAYSFDVDYESAKLTYNKMYETYFTIFKSLGLNKIIAVKADSGAIGGDLSHEFHIVADTGESAIYYDSCIDDVVASDKIDFDKLRTLYAAADEKHDQNKCADVNLVSKRGIEVGHIFYFGDKYSKALDFKVNSKDGNLFYPQMGSYGIGVSRLVGAIIEANSDEHGIIWPKEIAPFTVSLINLKITDENSTNFANKLYEELKFKNIRVLYDDTDNSVGAKFANHDLIGSPYQIIVGPKLAIEGKLEFKIRKTAHREILSPEEAISKINV